MNTWISKRAICALGFVSFLAACSDGGPAMFSFLGESAGNSATSKRAPLSALKSAEMMQGGAVFVPPEGYCIDKRTLTQSFAAISRCDTLGATDVGAGQALGLVTASIVPFEGDADLSSLLAGSVPEGATVLERSNTKSISVVRLDGASVDGLDETYWTGLARIGPGLARVSLYASDAEALNQAARARLLSSFVAESNRATAAKDGAVIVARKTPQTRNSPLNPLKKVLSGLFQ